MSLNSLVLQTAGLGLRSLLHVRSAPAPVEPEHAQEHLGETAAEHAAHESEQGTLDLRIAAIFVIWFGAVLFGIPTLLFKQFESLDAPFPRLLRSFAGGIIMALALVHIIPEAVTELNTLMEYPIGGCTVLFGIIFLVLVDSCLSSALAPEPYKAHVRQQSATAAAASTVKAPAVPCAHNHHRARTSKGQPATGSHEAAHAHKHPQHDHSAEKDIEAANEQLPVQFTQSAHSHSCMRSLNSTSWIASAAVPVFNVKQYVTAYTMELGCIFHSVIIGVGVGVITDDRHLVVTLMIALAVHQGLEALALGSVLALTGFHAIKKISMLLMYSITTPIGIGVGIAVSSSYDPESSTSKAVQGTLNGMSGGMLLYIGMYQLIAEEFSREDLLVKPRLRVGMYAALCFGAAVMCILGVWS